MHPQGHFHRTEFCGGRCDDEVARHGNLEPTTKAGAVDCGNDRDGQLFEAVEHVDRVECRLALVDDSFVPKADIGTRTEMPKGTFDQDRPASSLHGTIESFQHRERQKGQSSVNVFACAAPPTSAIKSGGSRPI